MKKRIFLILVAILITGLILVGCGKSNPEDAQANVPQQEADIGSLASQEETTAEETTANSIHEIEGWPADVPAPDFGGEIEKNNHGKSSIDLTFRDIDPSKAAQYIQKLKAEGFTAWLNEEDKLIDVYVDDAGNNVIHHSFIAAKGEPVYNEMIGGEIIENGYYIHMLYSDVDEYNAENNRLVSTPKVELYIEWDNPLVNK